MRVLSSFVRPRADVAIVAGWRRVGVAVVAIAACFGVALASVACSKDEPAPPAAASAPPAAPPTPPSSAPMVGVVGASASAGAPDPSSAASAPPSSPSGLASAAPSASGAKPAATCGDKPLPPCPLARWMKANASAAMTDQDFDALAQVLGKIAGFAPPGYANWVSISNDGADAAHAQSLDGVKAACRGCHNQYKSRYRREMRDRPI